MEEKVMVIGIIGIIIGLLVLGAGIYYLIKEKDDTESKKIYGITSGVGAAVTVAAAVILIMHL
ncbi:MAG: hypothetical protein J6O73_03410 [Lachnospiraceae bacterium]|nr:hypothetical protein [Lachnospiraceae bacterium]